MASGVAKFASSEHTKLKCDSAYNSVWSLAQSVFLASILGRNRWPVGDLMTLAAL
jgi:hypothetical protein